MNIAKHQDKVIFASVVFLVGLLGYNVVYKYNQGQLEKVRSAIEEEKKKAEVLNEMSILDKKLQGYKKRSFDTTEVTPLLDKISLLAREAGIEIETFSPMSLEQGREYACIPLNIPLECNYHKLGKLVSLLESNKEFIRIESIKIRKDEVAFSKEGGKLFVTLVVSGFYLVEDER